MPLFRNHHMMDINALRIPCPEGQSPLALASSCPSHCPRECRSGANHGKWYTACFKEAHGHRYKLMPRIKVKGLQRRRTSQGSPPHVPPATALPAASVMPPSAAPSTSPPPATWTMPPSTVPPTSTPPAIQTTSTPPSTAPPTACHERQAARLCIDDLALSEPLVRHITAGVALPKPRRAPLSQFGRPAEVDCWLGFQQRLGNGTGKPAGIPRSTHTRTRGGCAPVPAGTVLYTVETKFNVGSTDKWRAIMQPWVPVIPAGQLTSTRTRTRTGKTRLPVRVWATRAVA
ncbi:hypothetical protein GGX14DRAFT_399873 [Mycena pura]|uniref:Uncharacterized protein n=1 Tax=Mycena pura TaxID=153505 RepID=A0AAD6Y8D8_9AGAR|nr:hypothetical protein GGX14DRAFT_399873 [Mycena pura]